MLSGARSSMTPEELEKELMFLMERIERLEGKQPSRTPLLDKLEKLWPQMDEWRMRLGYEPTFAIVAPEGFRQALIYESRDEAIGVITHYQSAVILESPHMDKDNDPVLYVRTKEEK